MASLAGGFDDIGAMVGLDAFPVPLLTLDPGGVVLCANAAWTRAMTLRPGAPFARAVHPEDRARWQTLLQRARAHEESDEGGEGGAVRARLRLLHPSGDLRWFDCTVARAGASYGVALVDATQSQRREAALEARLRGVLGLLDGMPGLLYRGRNNRSWTMEIVSAGCEALTGYPREWFVDSHEHSFSQLILPEYADYVWYGVQEALAARDAFELRYRIRGADGRVKAVLEKGAGIYSEGGEVLGIEGAIFEVAQVA
ncbi:PAS domain-containing protein [Paraburkholderia sp. Ac-20340]|uniref:PAS domain-containing protein n=1 Tax=Paraburkholderia sp. Ac-20340 TaxID=2703888 RepID=UPI001980F582|nr:PAS domain-containing protein [Paraburkholderia sp. Ac-20340]MBN3854912.1 PAS domain-containing protein [Paraburkholderia sp. Ac-20340]